MAQIQEPTTLSPSSLGALDPRIAIPTYDRRGLGGGIVHIGVGGFHRAHQADYLDDLCTAGLRTWSITGAGVLPQDATMATALGAQDGLYSLITRSRQRTDVKVIGSIVDYVLADVDRSLLVDRLAEPSTRIVSLTVTEGGYPVDVATGQPTGTSPVFAAIAEGLRRRHDDAIPPFSVMSCDNILHNGTVTRAATINAAADIDSAVARWVEAEVAFPSTMVDRITPVTAPSDRQWLLDEFGLIDQWPVVAETFRQWVIEDVFTNGRPPWEDVGVLLTDNVEPYELLKLRILNAGHSTLAYLAALAGFEFVDEVMRDAVFAGFLDMFLDREARPVLPPVAGVDVADYKRVVVDRFANPAIRDQVSRLCLDGSSKFPVFLIPTVERQLAGDGHVELSALALAGWCQYLLGRDDEGRAIDTAADPRLELAINHAEASIADPAAFLRFAEVFPPAVAAHEGFRTAFTTALDSIRKNGARAAVAESAHRQEGP